MESEFQKKIMVSYLAAFKNLQSLYGHMTPIYPLTNTDQLNKEIAVTFRDLKELKDYCYYIFRYTDHPKFRTLVTASYANAKKNLCEVLLQLTPIDPILGETIVIDEIREARKFMELFLISAAYPDNVDSWSPRKPSEPLPKSMEGKFQKKDFFAPIKRWLRRCFGSPVELEISNYD